MAAPSPPFEPAPGLVALAIAGRRWSNDFGATRIRLTPKQN